MAIATLQHTFSRTLLSLGLISLIACGGGGGGKKAPAPDTIPNTYTYAATTNAEPSTLVTSTPATISGINTATPVSVVGGEYSISGGAFTSNPTTITNGQTLTVRIMASDKTNTPKEAVVTVGSVSAKFTVTTMADVTPDAFAFTPITAAELNSEQTSEPVIVKSIDVMVPVTITGGLYSINGSPFTSAPGTVTAEQTLIVRTTAAAKTETTQEAVLTIGGVSGTYAVTTIPDTAAPIAAFKFPTPYTMSEASTVKVRGTATDDHAITSVKVVVNGTTEIEATPKAQTNGVKDFSSWTATISLAEDKDNEIKVVATDERKNSIAMDAANMVVIRQADVGSAFPDENSQFISPTGGIVYDSYEGRDRLLVSDSALEALITVDLQTGKREIYKNMKSIGLHGIWGMLIDDSNDVPALYALEYEDGNLHKMDLKNGDILDTFSSALYREPRSLLMDKINNSDYLITINDDSFQQGDNGVISFSLLEETFSTISAPLAAPDYKNPWGIALDKEHNRYLVSKGNQNPDSSKHGIYSINRSTGERTLFSTNNIGSGESFSAVTEHGTALLRDIAVDVKNNRVIVPESVTGKLFSIDLDSAERKVIASFLYGGDTEVRPYVFNVELNPSSDVAYLTESTRNSILLIDLDTGEKVIITKSVNDF